MLDLLSRACTLKFVATASLATRILTQAMAHSNPRWEPFLAFISIVNRPVFLDVVRQQPKLLRVLIGHLRHPDPWRRLQAMIQLMRCALASSRSERTVSLIASFCRSGSKAQQLASGSCCEGKCTCSSGRPPPAFWAAMERLYSAYASFHRSGDSRQVLEFSCSELSACFADDLRAL